MYPHRAPDGRSGGTVRGGARTECVWVWLFPESLRPKAFSTMQDLSRTIRERACPSDLLYFTPGKREGGRCLCRGAPKAASNKRQLRNTRRHPCQVGQVKILIFPCCRTFFDAPEGPAPPSNGNKAAEERALTTKLTDRIEMHHT